MVVRELVGRDKLFQTRAVTVGKMVRRMGVLVDDHRPSPPIMTLVTAALISLDDFVNVAHCSM